MRYFDVSLGNPGEPDFNTIFLGRIDLEIPLEADLDGDPLHDDEVRLLSEGGAYDSTLCADDPDVRYLSDRNVYVYRFRQVPPGRYRVLVRVSEQDWATVVGALLVHRTGARLGDKELVVGAEPEAITSTPGDAEPAADDLLPPELDGLGEYMDVADNFFEED